MQASSAAGAYPAMNIIFQIIPLVLLVIPYVVINGVVAKRKGKSPLLYALLAIIPVANIVTTIWLLSLTDSAVMKDLEAIEAKIAELERKNVIV
jgi:hypothetical protein